MKKKIYLSPPDMSGNELKYLINSFESNWISSVGPSLDDFEKKIKKYLSVNYACAVNSGTSALHLSLRVLKIKENDRVICPSLTFAASANVILYEKAIPVFIDVDLNSWTLDLNILEISFKKHNPKALIAVDLYGEPCQYEGIIDLCKKYDVSLIEDAAEALGSEYNGRKLGSYGDISILSFNGNKIITTSGGGMILSDNKDYIDQAKFLANQAREKKIHYEHKKLGYNYRMSNLLAAIGIGQLENIENFVLKRRAIFSRYRKAFTEFEGIKMLEEEKNTRGNKWLTSMTIDEKLLSCNRDDIIKALDKENIESRPVWKPMHMQPLYKDYDYLHLRGKDVSKYLFDKGICLPSGSNLQIAEQDKIIDIITSFLIGKSE